MSKLLLVQQRCGQNRQLPTYAIVHMLHLIKLSRNSSLTCCFTRDKPKLINQSVINHLSATLVVQYGIAFSKSHWFSGWDSLQSTDELKSSLRHWRVAEHWNSAKAMQKEGKKYRRMGKPTCPYDISSRIIKVRYRKLQVWRDFSHRASCGGQVFCCPFIPPWKMESSKATVLWIPCPLPSAITVAGSLYIMLNWPNLNQVSPVSDFLT